MTDWTEDKGSGGVRGSKLTAMMSAHRDSPYQKTYGSVSDYDRHAKKLRAGVMGDGTTLPSASGDIHQHAQALPVGEHEWYGVGGATDTRTGQRAPEKNYNLSNTQFTHSDALEHVLDVEGHNIDRARSGRAPVYAGGWNETDEHGEHHAVLDHTNVYTDENKARWHTEQRGERAYFDAKNIVSRDSLGRVVD